MPKIGLAVPCHGLTTFIPPNDLFLLGSLLCSQPEVAIVEGLGICNLLALICGLVGFVVNHREHTTKRQD